MSRNLAVKTVAELYPPKCDEAVKALAEEIVSFRPEGVGPVELRRALSIAERTALQTRANLLDRWLAPGMQGDIAAAVTGMLLGFSSRNMSVDEAREIAAQWASALRDLPGWAVHRACARFSQGRVRASDLGVKSLDVGFSPTTAQVHRVAEAVMAAEVAERARLDAVLKGTVTREAPAKAPATETTAPKVHLKHLDEAEQERRDAAVRRQESESSTVEKNNNDARRAEYARAGLRPPEPHGGIVVSLPMMLKMGFKIAKVRGETVLVQGKEERA